MRRAYGAGKARDERLELAQGFPVVLEEKDERLELRLDAPEPLSLPRLELV
ncbi:MAG: hypothetical protein WC683_18135 [bacterium]